MEENVLQSDINAVNQSGGFREATANVSTQNSQKRRLQKTENVLTQSFNCKENIVPSKKEVEFGNSNLKRISDKLNGLRERQGKIGRLTLQTVEKESQTEAREEECGKQAVEILERDVSRLRYENLKLEQALKQAQE